MQENAGEFFTLLTKAKSGDDSARNDLHTGLLSRARDAARASYSPYSKFPVGAALLTRKGDVFTGCNVENASYGAGVCAERTAIVKAVSEGHKDFEMIAVVCGTAKNIWPCGICRQFICEFGAGIVVIAENERDEIEVMTISELLPKLFGPEALGL